MVEDINKPSEEEIDPIQAQINNLEKKLDQANSVARLYRAGLINDSELQEFGETLGVDFHNPWFKADDYHRDMLFLAKEHDVLPIMQDALDVIEMGKLIASFKEAIRAVESSGVEDKDDLIKYFKSGEKELKNKINTLLPETKK